jgi:hypothetical protein
LSQHIYEVRPRRDKLGFDLLWEALSFGKLWYDDADAAVGYAKFYSRAQPAVIRIYDSSGALAGDVSARGRIPRTVKRTPNFFFAGRTDCSGGNLRRIHADVARLQRVTSRTIFRLCHPELL